MNTRLFGIIAALLVVSSVSLAKPDWLDDLNDGTGRLVQTINENAVKVNQLTHNLGILAHILQQADVNRDESNEE